MVKITAALAIASTANAMAIAGGAEHPKYAGTVTFYNNCTQNVHVWEQASSTKKLAVIPHGYSHALPLHAAGRGNDPITYQFALGDKNHGRDGKAHISYRWGASDNYIWGQAHIYNVLGAPFRGQRVSLGASSAATVALGAAAAAAAGSQVGVSIEYEEQLLSSTLSLGGAFCVNGGFDLDELEPKQFDSSKPAFRDAKETYSNWKPVKAQTIDTAKV